MFCTNCGFENPALHRFCGMCGTPLPQRPITAPGAQSTVGLTRLPLEVPQTTGSTVANVSNASAIETPETQPSGTAGSAYFSQAEQAESLEQFIAGFRYTPPAEEDEVTMTGNKPVLDSTDAANNELPLNRRSRRFNPPTFRSVLPGFFTKSPLLMRGPSRLRCT